MMWSQKHFKNVWNQILFPKMKMFITLVHWEHLNFKNVHFKEFLVKRND